MIVEHGAGSREQEAVISEQGAGRCDQRKGKKGAGSKEKSVLNSRRQGLGFSEIWKTNRRIEEEVVTGSGLVEEV